MSEAAHANHETVETTVSMAWPIMSDELPTHMKPDSSGLLPEGLQPSQHTSHLACELKPC